MKYEYESDVLVSHLEWREDVVFRIAVKQASIRKNVIENTPFKFLFLLPNTVSTMTRDYQAN